MHASGLAELIGFNPNDLFDRPGNNLVKVKPKTIEAVSKNWIGLDGLLHHEKLKSFSNYVVQEAYFLGFENGQRAQQTLIQPPKLIVAALENKALFLVAGALAFYGAWRVASDLRTKFNRAQKNF